ncbi:cell division protein CrgA [Pseudonocardia acidicola]|uniref:Cell division protein CrgA n=1 Tax=Pseudonocardia acidicola TaxID=2724939 RepID=A0ABX1SG47_9PSEU|nr:cell division protein CrgA [Pseudonocardia acidicola]NMI00526.1 cell division protein CrgA [Pseudonocardia acidicola]
MPKSKVRKKVAYTPPPTVQKAAARAAGPTHPVYVVVMLGLMLVGLAWLVVNYLAGQSIGFMVALGAWNFLIGFALIVIGLLMTMRWR